MWKESALYTTIHGIRIHYEISGEGSPVLVLHGWGATLEAVQPIINAVVSLGMRAVALEFPGFGESGDPPRPFSVAEYAAVTKAFMQELALEKPDVVCHSFGGRVTIYLAGEEPSLFSRLVLIDAAGIRPRRGLRYYIRTLTYKAGKQLAKMQWFDRISHFSEKRANAGSADYRALKTDTMRATFIKVVNQDLSARLPRIANPTLIIWGSEDTSTPLYMAKRMEKEIPDAGLVVLEGAGHFSYADQYATFCAVLRAFLK